MHGWVIEAVVDGTVGAVRVAPVRPFHLSPPWRRRHAARGRKIVREQPAEHERPSVALATRDVTGGLAERYEVAIGDCGWRDVKGRDGDLVNRVLTVVDVPVVGCGTHPEGSRWDLH